ncbi:MAG: gliding motility-associated C-terminal domain-containing protein [Bacteroidota bacterium]
MKRICLLLLFIAVCTTSNLLHAQSVVGYSYYREIQLPLSNHGLVANAAAVPVYFDTIATEFKSVSNGGHVQSEQGNDIEFFTLTSCTSIVPASKLNHQLVEYNPVTGRLRAWVNLTYADALVGTFKIAVYYGNPSATAPTQNTTNFWNSNYKAIWHFDNVNTSDATPNNTLVTDTGEVLVTPSVLGPGRDLSNHSPFIIIDSLRDPGGRPAKFIGLPNNFLQGFRNFTFEGWVRQYSTATSWERVFGFGKSQQVSMYFSPSMFADATNCQSTFRVSNVATTAENQVTCWNGNAGGPTDILTQIWAHWAIVYDYDNHVMQIYKNGVAKITDGSQNIPPAMMAQLSSLVPGRGSNYIGRSNYRSSNDQYLDAVIDEFRISDVARPASYILSQYQVQKQGKNYCRISGEKQKITSVLAADNFTTNSRTFSTNMSVCEGETLVINVAGRFPGVYNNWATISPAARNDTGRTHMVIGGRAGQTIVINETQRNSQGCAGPITNIIISVQASPAKPAIALSAARVCVPGVVTLTGPTGMAKWAWSNGDTTQSISFSSAGAHSVSLKVTNSTGCQSVDSSVTVYVDTLPANAKVDNNLVSICGPDRVRFTVEEEPNTTYKWYNDLGQLVYTGVSYLTDTINLNSGTHFTVEANNAHCPALVRTPVDVNFFSAIDAPHQTGGPVTRCGSGTVQFPVAGALGTAKYRWYSAASGGTKLQDSTLAVFTTPVISATDTFYVSIFNGRCETPRIPVIAHITPGPSPIISPMASGLAKCFVPGEQQTFNVFNRSNPNTVFTWKHGTETVTGTTTYSFTPTKAGADTVKLTETDPNGGCVGEANPVILTFYPNPGTDLEITGTTVLCAGDSAGFTLAGYTGSTYNFPVPQNASILSTSGNRAVVQFGSPGTYIVKATETTSFGCVGTERSLQVFVRASPEPVLSGAHIICPQRDSTYLYSAVLTPGAVYTWKVTGARSFRADNNTASVFWVPDSAVGRSVTVTENFNGTKCEGTSVINVYADSLLTLPDSPCKIEDYPMDVPNIYTPNGDGINDEFIVRNFRYYGISRLQVFNRWGKQVYDRTLNEHNWDGSNLPSATYFYILQSERGGKIKHGWIDISR